MEERAHAIRDRLADFDAALDYLLRGLCMIAGANITTTTAITTAQTWFVR